VEFTERGVGRKRNLNKIAYAADIDEHLIRAFFGEASAELANHGRPVLPPFLRLSTRLAWLRARERFGRSRELGRAIVCKWELEKYEQLVFFRGYGMIEISRSGASTEGLGIWKAGILLGGAGGFFSASR
jgi:hypothetical protein